MSHMYVRKNTMMQKLRRVAVHIKPFPCPADEDGKLLFVPSSVTAEWLISFLFLSIGNVYLLLFRP